MNEDLPPIKQTGVVEELWCEGCQTTHEMDTILISNEAGAVIQLVRQLVVSLGVLDAMAEVRDLTFEDLVDEIENRVDHPVANDARDVARKYLVPLVHELNDGVYD